MWFGTRNGLNRYDGVNLVSFFHRDNDSFSLTNNLITTIQVGNDGILLIGTYEGVSLFDQEHFKFHNLDYFVKGKNEFQPLPQREIELSNGNLAQNPSW